MTHPRKDPSASLFGLLRRLRRAQPGTQRGRKNVSVNWKSATSLKEPPLG
jgi:hypothetical protein